MPTKKAILRKAVLSLILLCAVPATAKSNINPINRSYGVSEFDEFSDVRLRRSYSSGSIFRGHFGPGWCSEIDGRILSYAGGELRYRGCNVDTADLVDSRATEKSLQRTTRGFRRIREDGAIQFFTHSGFLERVSGVSGGPGVRVELRINRDDDGYPASLSIVNRGKELVYRIELDSKRSDPCYALIRAIGPRNTFGYTNGLLTTRANDSVSIAKYGYDDQHNMTTRFLDGESEVVDYDEPTDRVVRVVRSSAFGRERLLFAETRNEKSKTIEIRLEIERGAETHPVRILYDAVSHRVSLEGDRDVAAFLLTWIRS